MSEPSWAWVLQKCPRDMRSMGEDGATMWGSWPRVLCCSSFISHIFQPPLENGPSSRSNHARTVLARGRWKNGLQRPQVSHLLCTSDRGRIIITQEAWGHHRGGSAWPLQHGRPNSQCVWESLLPAPNGLDCSLVMLLFGHRYRKDSLSLSGSHLPKCQRHWPIPPLFKKKHGITTYI